MYVREAPVVRLEVKNFRGVREGSIKDFAAVNIFVGRNGTGKSSILEALYIALKPDEGLAYVVKRRGWFGLASAEALFYHGQREIHISATLKDGNKTGIKIKPDMPSAGAIPVLRERGLHVEKLIALDLETVGGVKASLYMDEDGKFHYIFPQEWPRPIYEAVFVDWNSVYQYGSPEEAYSRMVAKAGAAAKESVVKALRSQYKDLSDVVPLYIHGRWVLHLVFENASVPIYVAGDGVRYALTLLIQALTPSGGVVLLEEPELHVHPNLMRIAANAILRSHIDRGNQIFVTTHSLELIKMMIEEARKVGAKNLKLFRLALDRGALHTEEYTLDEAWRALELEWDLRK